MMKSAAVRLVLFYIIATAILWAVNMMFATNVPDLGHFFWPALLFLIPISFPGMIVALLVSDGNLIVVLVVNIIIYFLIGLWIDRRRAAKNQQVSIQ